MVPVSILGMVSGFFSDIFFPTVPWPWGRLSSLWKWVPGIFSEGKSGRCVRTVISQPSCVECHEILEPISLGTLWSTQGLLQDYFTLTFIQGVPGGKVNNLGVDTIGHCEGKIYIHVCIILNDYQDTDVWISWPNPLGSFVVLDEGRSLPKKGGHSSGIAGWHFGCCWLHKETRRSNQTNNTRSSQTSYKVNWGWRWDFWTFIVDGL